MPSTGDGYQMTLVCNLKQCLLAHNLTNMSIIKMLDFCYPDKLQNDISVCFSFFLITGKAYYLSFV